MHARASRLVAAFTLTLLLAAACDTASEDGEATGTAPQITNLQLPADPVTVGETSVLNGTFDFSDEDGDVDRVAARVTLPDGSSQTLPDMALQGVAGVEQGSAVFQLYLQPPAAGTYTFTLALRDEGGNRSNELTGSITAQ